MSDEPHSALERAPRTPPAASLDASAIPLSASGEVVESRQRAERGTTIAEVAEGHIGRRSVLIGSATLLAGCGKESSEVKNPRQRPGPTRYVQSADGTRIAYERWGSGPPIVLVDGAFCSRRFGPTDSLAPLLAPNFTVFAYDRRGRGESGDSPDNDVGREVEDLAALIEAAGGRPNVFGMSSGGALALQAAGRGIPMARLAVYEVPYFALNAEKRPPADLDGRIRSFLRSNDPGGAIKFYMTDVMRMPWLLVKIIPFTSNWEPLKKSAPSLRHEIALMGDFAAPTDLLSKVRVPTVALAGEKTEEGMLVAMRTIASTVPGCKSGILAQQTHDVSMSVLEPILAKFFHER